MSMRFAFPHLPEHRCHAMSAVGRSAAFVALMSSACSSNPPSSVSAADYGEDGHATAGAIFGGAAGAAVGAVGGATLGALGAVALCAPFGPFAIFCAPAGAVVGGVGGAVKLGKRGAEWGAEAATASPRSIADTPEPIVAAAASETVDAGTDSFESARSAAQIGRGGDRPVLAEVLELPGTTETPVNTAGLAQEPGVAAPAPVALAAPSDAATHSPRPPVTGLPATGSQWVYGFIDRQYSRRQIDVTVRAMRVNGSLIDESVAFSGPSDVETQRSVSAGEARFFTHRFANGEELTEFAPYFLAVNSEKIPAIAIAATGYPVGSSSLPGFTSTARIQGWEQVTVPAGTFRALRVEMAGNRRLDFFTRDAVAGRFKLTVWYAPEVRRFVRLEHMAWSAYRDAPAQLNHDVVELLSFRPPS